MLTFLDGPALAATGLLVRRAPLLLRIVRDRDSGAFDACDQPEDSPRPWEEVWVYRLVQRRGTACVAGKKGRGRMCCAIATYQVVTPQPDEKTLRWASKWREWAAAEAAKVQG